MIAYIDSSVLISFLFESASKSNSVLWRKWESIYSSRLLQVEVMRTIDCKRKRQEIDDNEVAEAVHTFINSTETFGEIPISDTVLRRASLSFPTVVRTLDAIHLASALLLKERTGKEVTFLTHDRQLGTAAIAVGLDVKGF